MNHTLHILTLFALILGLGGCAESISKKRSSANDTTAAVQAQLSEERQRRSQAELLAGDEAERRRLLELALAAVGLFAVAAFIGGTAIGTRGKRDAATQA